MSNSRAAHKLLTGNVSMSLSRSLSRSLSSPSSLSFSSIVKAVEGPRRDDKRMGGYAAFGARGVR